MAGILEERRTERERTFRSASSPTVPHLRDIFSEGLRKAARNPVPVGKDRNLCVKPHPAVERQAAVPLEAREGQ